jgi:hypothetical protein
METTENKTPSRDPQLVELASPSEIGLLALGLGALATALFSWRRRSQARKVRR